MRKNYGFTFLIILTFISCVNRNISNSESNLRIPNYEVKIENFYGAEGITLKWYITKDSIKVIYNCDFVGCKDTLLFSKLIDTNSSKIYYNNLKKIPLNKLKKEYDNSSIMDGLYERIEVKKVYEKDVNINLHMIQKSEIDDLYKLTDSLLLKNTKFKINQKN